MQHVIEATDIPPVVLVERRYRPSRRGFWRGGRRNTDWTNRPIDAWRYMEQRLPPWRQWLAKLTLHLAH
jgi:hypothetical protein